MTGIQAEDQRDRINTIMHKIRLFQPGCTSLPGLFNRSICVVDTLRPKHMVIGKILSIGCGGDDEGVKLYITPKKLSGKTIQYLKYDGDRWIAAVNAKFFPNFFKCVTMEIQLFSFGDV